ncbi:hypothetical protein ACI797_23625 [Geodermatophilus sp. SYSU D00691]
MSTPAKVAAFALGLVATFGAALGVGAAVGPVDVAPAADAEHAATGGGHAAEEEHPAGGTSPQPAGLAISDGGYTLHLDADTAPSGPATPVTFHVLDDEGTAVTDFAVEHEQRLHLIAVRRDLSGYQHLHPQMAADGTWTATLALTPGSWRVLADFVPAADGAKRVLGADLAVPGELVPAALPATTRTVEVDGYTVTLDGDLVPGEETRLTATVARDGQAVTDLQPYLGAYGHLVVLRAGDLAYVHVHPDDGAGAGPRIPFTTTAPTDGTYRLFLDFRHGDVVRTAEFTVDAGEGHDHG